MNFVQPDFIARFDGFWRNEVAGAPAGDSLPSRAPTQTLLVDRSQKRCSARDAADAAAQAVATPDRWMRVLRDIPCTHLPQKRLVDISIVGAHHAGAFLSELIAPRMAALGSLCSSNNIGPCEQWSRAQHGTVLQQLTSGVRYLDFRVTYDSAVCSDSAHQDRSCWKLWNNLLMMPVEQELTNIAEFMEGDLNAGLQSEVVILDLRMQHFEEPSSMDGTNERLRVLLSMVNEVLGDYAYDGREFWDQVPLGTIMDSDRRLIILLDLWTAGSSYTRDQFSSFLNAQFSRSALARMRAICKIYPEATEDTDSTCETPLWVAQERNMRREQPCCQEEEMLQKQKEYQHIFQAQYIGSRPYDDYIMNLDARRPLLQLFITMTKQWSRSGHVWALSTADFELTSNEVRVHNLLESARVANALVPNFFYNISLQDGVGIFGNIIMADGLASDNASEPSSQVMLEVAARFTAGGPPTENVATPAPVTTLLTTSPPHSGPHGLGAGFWLLVVGVAVLVAVLVSLCTFGNVFSGCCNRDDANDQRGDGDSVRNYFKSIMDMLPWAKKDRRESQKTFGRSNSSKSIKRQKSHRESKSQRKKSHDHTTLVEMTEGHHKHKKAADAEVEHEVSPWGT